MTYALHDGTEVDGYAERVCRVLDAADPLDERARLDTDIGTADLVAAANPEARWCEEARRLIVPSGYDCYAERPPEALEALVTETCKARLAWAESRLARACEEDGGSRAEAAKRYLGFCKKAGAAHVKGAARSFQVRNRIAAADLNREGTVIGTPDGVVDLDYASLMSDLGWDDAKAFRVTKSTRARIPSERFPDAEPDPRWEEFVLEIMCGDAERAAYLKRAMGYSIMGGNPEEVMFVAYGPSSRNGKGTLMESVAWALGDYAATVDHDYLTEGRPGASGGADEETASLAGVRLVNISEPTKGRRLDEAKVKMLTGGDMVSCRHLYGPRFEYRPDFTIWMSCNRLPPVSDPTVFASGRIKVVPFERHFEESERDRSLKSRFRSEDGMAAILTWLIEGYLDYKERGLDEPASVKEATERYAGTGGTSLSRFVDDCCEVGISERVSVADFKSAYRAWCEAEDEPPMGQRALVRELAELGVSSARTNSARLYRGICLNVRGAVLAAGEGDVKGDPAGAETSRKGTGPDENVTGSGGSGRIKLS
ncbi:MAG: phage/plasmid primase, P4 family [Eggerthellaceae bacterium]